MRSDNSLHATSTPWALRDRLRSQSPVRTPWERGGTPWALLGNANVAVGAPWHLHVMENVKLIAILFSIFVRSHGALRSFKLPCQRRGIAVECDKGFTYSEGQTSFHCVYSFSMIHLNIPDIPVTHPVSFDPSLGHAYTGLGHNYVYTLQQGWLSILYHMNAKFICALRVHFSLLLELWCEHHTYTRSVWRVLLNNY